MLDLPGAIETYVLPRIRAKVALIRGSTKLLLFNVIADISSILHLPVIFVGHLYILVNC
jgi:hypothetical protein